jgi:hypothetical protein
MHKLENERPFGVVEYRLCDPPDLIGSVAKFFEIGVLWHVVQPLDPTEPYFDCDERDAQNSTLLPSVPVLAALRRISLQIVPPSRLAREHGNGL